MSWIRERTRTEHESIERVVPLMRADVTRADYAFYLERMRSDFIA